MVSFVHLARVRIEHVDVRLPEPLLEQILTRTDGVPLSVEELTKAVLESSELKDAGDYYLCCVRK